MLTSRTTSIPDSNPLKKLVLASGYVDHNLLMRKAGEANEVKEAE